MILLTLELITMATTLVAAAARGAPCYCLTEELSDLRMPIHVAPVTGDNFYLIAEQRGIILKYSPNVDSSQKLTTYINITDKVKCESKLFEERGLLGFAIHPKFVTNKKVYTYSIRLFNGKEHSVITEITNGDVLQEKILLAVEQPGGQRNGGQLLFGKDGYLYIFIGDGGPEEDHKTEAQNGNSLLGKILRIDVDRTIVEDYRPKYYRVPGTNPMKPGWRPEIFALGTRNMWRCSVDKGDKNGNGKGRIFCGELGSSLADELNLVEKGGNYGWHYREGLTCLNPAKCGTIDNEVLPLYALNRSSSPVHAVVGGPLYRGVEFPGVTGQLLYGDFISGDLYKLKEADNRSWSSSTFPTCDHSVCGCNARAVRRSHLLSFGQTTNDEVFMLMTDDPNPAESKGALLRLVPPLRGKPVTCDSCRHVSNAWLIMTVASCLHCVLHYTEKS